MAVIPPRVQASEAAERARLVSEFQLRKREAAANRARGVAQWGAYQAPYEVGGAGREEAMRHAGTVVG